MDDGILDASDARIVQAISANPRASTTRIAQLVQLARGTVISRLNRMEEVLSPYERRVPPAALGLTLTAFVHAQVVHRNSDELAQELMAIPEVIEAFGISGEWDVIVRVAASDADDLYRVSELILEIPGITRTAVTLAMRALVPPRMGPLVERAIRGGA